MLHYEPYEFHGDPSEPVSEKPWERGPTEPTTESTLVFSGPGLVSSVSDTTPTTESP